MKFLAIFSTLVIASVSVSAAPISARAGAITKDQLNGLQNAAFRASDALSLCTAQNEFSTGDGICQKERDAKNAADAKLKAATDQIVADAKNDPDQQALLDAQSQFQQVDQDLAQCAAAGSDCGPFAIKENDLKKQISDLTAKLQGSAVNDAQAAISKLRDAQTDAENDFAQCSFSGGNCADEQKAADAAKAKVAAALDALNKSQAQSPATVLDI